MRKFRKHAAYAERAKLGLVLFVMLSMVFNACSWWGEHKKESNKENQNETKLVDENDNIPSVVNQTNQQSPQLVQKQPVDEEITSEDTSTLEQNKPNTPEPSIRPSAPPVVSDKKIKPDVMSAKETLPKNPNQFKVTVDKKDETHPFYKKGHDLGLLINAVQGKTIVVVRGKKYEFLVDTDVKHDVYISTSPMGWGGGVFTSGIEGYFTYNGTITLKADKDTPDVLYYQCRNHNSMGGKILAVNADVSQLEINALLQSSSAPKEEKKFTSPKLKFTGITKEGVQQKIAFADMMLKAKAAQRISASNNQEAKNLLAKAKTDLDQARKTLKDNQIQDALALANTALGSVGVASRMVPSEEVLDRQKKRYEELLAALETFKKSHIATVKSTKKKRGKDAVVDFDRERVSILEKEAIDYAAQGQHVIAGQYLENAERMVTTAINEMMDSQTVVYDLKFETAEEEFDYELKRYISYEELIPIAIEQKKPSKAVLGLMGSFEKKGREQKDIAVKTSKSGDFPRAIAMMLSATEQIRRALRLAGVDQ